MNALEAVKAFAEELKAKAETEYYYDVETRHTYIYRTVDLDDIDDLVKEFEATLKTNTISKTH